MISDVLQYGEVSTEYSPIPDFLDSMRESGDFDSEGSITVNRRRAERMLAQYRLQSPYQYVLKLIQALVEAELAEIHVTCDKTKVRLRCPGQFCTLEEWQKYLEDSGEQGDGVEGRFLHLQVALNALDKLEPSLVTLLCVSEEEGKGFRFDSTQNESSLTPLRVEKMAQTEIEIVRKQASYGAQQFPPLWSLLKTVAERDMFDLYAELKSNRDSEYSQIWRRCSFSPIPIYLNRIAVNRPHFGKPKRYARLHSQSRNLKIVPAVRVGMATTFSVLSPQFGPDVVPVLGGYSGASGMASRRKPWFNGAGFPLRAPGPVLEEVSGAGVFAEATRPGGVWPALSLHLNEEVFLAGVCALERSQNLFFSGKNWLCFVKGGVLIEKLSSREHGLEDWNAVVSAGELPTDLTGFQLLRGERFDKTIGILQDLVRGS